MMRRREFITLLGGVVAWPLAARAQHSTKVARIGILGLAPAAAWAGPIEALRTRLRELRYVEGAQQAGPVCPAIDLEKNWRRKEERLAYSVQAIDLIGAP